MEQILLFMQKYQEPPSVIGIKVWATSQSDMDTSSWNGFTATAMTLSGGIYQAIIPANTTAFFVHVDDEKDGVTGVVTSKPEPVNKDYPQLFLPPGTVDSINVSRTGFDITLSWLNPNSSDYVGTIIVFSTSGFPQTPLQGTVIFDGNDEQFTHVVSDTITTYYYTVFCYDSVGNYSSGININSLGNSSGIQEFILEDNLNLFIYPNPASQVVNIIYDCQRNEYCDINIYDISGKMIETIYSGNLQQGKHIFVWNSLKNNNKISNGSYFCIVQTRNNRSIKKIILSRFEKY